MFIVLEMDGNKIQQTLILLNINISDGTESYNYVNIIIYEHTDLTRKCTQFLFQQ